MKLHPSLIQKLIEVYTINSGWAGEEKLKKALNNLDFTVYTQQDGNQILVDTVEYNKRLVDVQATNNQGFYSSTKITK